VRPGNCRRVNIQAKRIASGKLTTTLRVATLKLKVRASLSLGLNHIMLRKLHSGAGVHS
jgi:hypothetical protein